MHRINLTLLLLLFLVSGAFGASRDVLVPSWERPIVCQFLGSNTTAQCGITNTQAGTPKYWSAAGVLTAASGANVLRFDYNNTISPQGIFNEVAATNLQKQSQTQGTTGWASAGNKTFNVTPNSAVAPDGTTTAASIVAGAVSVAGTDYALQYSTNTYTATAATYSNCLWMKGAAGGENPGVWAVHSTTYIQLQVSLTTSWQRYCATGTETATTYNFEYGNDLRTGSAFVASPAMTFYVWGAQAELGAFGSSYISTTTTAQTRATDSLSTPTGVATKPSIIEYTPQSTGVPVRTAYAAGAFAWPASSWIRQLCIYPKGTPMAYVNKHLTVGGAC